MKIEGANCLVMFCVKVFCKVVSQVFFSRLPRDVEIVACNLVDNPKEVLFHCARTLFLDGIVGDGNSGAVVAVHGRCRLRMSEFFECEAENGGILESWHV